MTLYGEFKALEHSSNRANRVQKSKMREIVKI
jgi:hypothetical protein